MSLCSCVYCLRGTITKCLFRNFGLRCHTRGLKKKYVHALYSFQCAEATIAVVFRYLTGARMVAATNVALSFHIVNTVSLYIYIDAYLCARYILDENLSIFGGGGGVCVWVSACNNVYHVPHIQEIHPAK